jgi:hypothetical protein
MLTHPPKIVALDTAFSFGEISQSHLIVPGKHVKHITDHNKANG